MYKRLNLRSNEEALALLVEAVEQACFVPGEEIALTIDAAASEFYDDGKYQLSGENRNLDSTDFAGYLADLVDRYPIVSIEDGMDEQDFDGWSDLTTALGDRIQLVGDDLFVTNSERLEDGVNRGIAN